MMPQNGMRDSPTYSNVRFTTDRGADTDEVEILVISRDSTGVIRLTISEELHQAAKDFWYVVKRLASSREKLYVKLFPNEEGNLQ